MKLERMVFTLGAIALTCAVSAAYADEPTPVPASHSKFKAKHHPAAASTIASSANPSDFNDKWEGTYSSSEINFVTIKRLTFNKEKDGSLRIQGALVGFPDEVSIGDAVAEPYADRNSKNNPNEVLASFSSEKFKPLMVITAGGWDRGHVNQIMFTCYMKDVDGSKVHISGSLMRAP